MKSSAISRHPDSMVSVIFESRVIITQKDAINTGSKITESNEKSMGMYTQDRPALRSLFELQR